MTPYVRGRRHAGGCEGGEGDTGDTVRGTRLSGGADTARTGIAMATNSGVVVLVLPVTGGALPPVALLAIAGDAVVGKYVGKGGVPMTTAGVGAAVPPTIDTGPTHSSIESLRLIIQLISRIPVSIRLSE